MELFLAPGSGRPEWVSTDLRNPTFLTVATYQALHAVCSGQPEEHAPLEAQENGASKSHFEVQTNGDDENHLSRARVEIPEFLTQAAFKALVLDEAHHLRAEWWRVLTSFSDHLQQPTIVALTATPPYDVSPFEWQRYEELCGPVDAEVSVPELVQEGDLCPHQDYVYFSTPNEQELKVIADFRFAVDSFAAKLRANSDFGNAVSRHPWLTSPEQHTEDILDDPEYLSSIVVFLHGIAREVPPAVLKVLGLADKRIPALNLEWLEVLLSHCLYSDAANFQQIEATLKSIRRELLAIGAVERHKVKLRDPSDHLKLLTTSVTKLKSVEEIVKLEAGAFGNQLRCVILTDFIRKTELPTSQHESPMFEDIGIVPVFESLRHLAVPGINLGVLDSSTTATSATSRRAATDRLAAISTRVSRPQLRRTELQPYRARLGV